MKYWDNLAIWLDLLVLGDDVARAQRLPLIVLAHHVREDLDETKGGVTNETLQTGKGVLAISQSIIQTYDPINHSTSLPSPWCAGCSA